MASGFDANRDPRRNKLIKPLLNVSTFDDWISWIQKNSKTLLLNAGATYVPDDFELEITFLSLQWQDKVSNTHSAPWGKEQNWGGMHTHRGVPTGYPGWCGRIEWNQTTKTKRKTSMFQFSQNIWSNTPVHTGTGTGGTQTGRGQFDVRLYAEEWPGLARAHHKLLDAWEREAVIKGIEGSRQEPFKFKFTHGSSSWYR